MKDRNPPEKNWKSGAFWTAVLFGPALLFTGCATTPPPPEVTSGDLRTLQQRVEDVERTNGRLGVRVEEVERRMALMQDRVESNRIALQRRGYLRQHGDFYAEAPVRQERPSPAPETHYSRPDDDGQYRADPRVQQRLDQRGVSRIPLSGEQAGTSQNFDSHDTWVADSSPAEEQREIVITNETLEEYFGPSSSSSSSTNRGSTSSSSSSSSPSPQRRSGAHPPVTSERLPTSNELSASQPAERSSSSMSQRELLDLYQDSLAQYRAGEFGQALRGFTQFLEAGPRADYVDNALYWIGECHYGLGRYQESITHFQRILDDLPTADKVPDAMLKMSLAYDRMGEPRRAVALLEELTERFPNSNPGRLGAERLAEHPLFDGD